MIPRTSIVLCAVIFFALSLCDSFSKADESELKRDSKIAGIEDRGVEWGEKENFEDVNQLDELKTSKYGMERDGTKRMVAGERRSYWPKCSGKPFNPILYFCCNGSLVYSGRNISVKLGCCGGVVYDATFSLCCNGKLKPKIEWNPSC